MTNRGSNATSSNGSHAPTTYLFGGDDFFIYMMWNSNRVGFLIEEIDIVEAHRASIAVFQSESIKKAHVRLWGRR